MEIASFPGPCTLFAHIPPRRGSPATATHERPFARLASCLAVAAAVLSPSAGVGQTGERTPVLTTRHFAFYDDAETNLNDALTTAGVARSHTTDEFFHSGEGEACFAKLPPSARAAWNQSVDYYAEIVSPHEFYERPQYLLRAYLAGYDDRPSDDSFFL